MAIIFFVLFLIGKRDGVGFDEYLSKRRPMLLFKSICQYVCVSVCLSVGSLLRYRLIVFLPPLPEIECPIFLNIGNPWGKVMKISGLIFENFY